MANNHKVILHGLYDIGLLLPKAKYTKLMGKKNLRRLLLPPEDGDSFITDRTVKISGWGRVLDIQGNNPRTTSCMTTNQGPVGNYFQPCKSPCIHTYPPNLLKKTKCKDFWRKAKTVFSKGLSNIDEWLSQHTFWLDKFAGYI